MPRLIWVFAGHTVTLLVSSCRGPYKFAKKYSKIISSEDIIRMKLKLCNISLYIMFFYCRCSCALVAMAIWSFHWLVMGKWKLVFIAVSFQVFLQKFLRNVSWVVRYQTYNLAFIAISQQIFWHKFWRNVPWIVFYQTYQFFWTAEFDWLPKILKNHLLRRHNEDEAETLQH